jgi:hypothetical protein
MDFFGASQTSQRYLGHLVMHVPDASQTSQTLPSTECKYSGHMLSPGKYRVQMGMTEEAVVFP